MDDGKIHAINGVDFFYSQLNLGGKVMANAKYQEHVLEVEPFGIDQIPQEERHGRIRQIFTLWFASDLNIVTWFTGFLGVELGLSIWWAILAIIVGNLLGGICLALASMVGPELGRPLVPASEHAFGLNGMRGLSFLNLINNIGWLAVNLVLSVLAFQIILPMLGYHLALIILAVATLFIAVYGYNFIHAFSHWMTIIMGLFFVAMTYISIHNLTGIIHAGNAATGGFSWGIFILAAVISFSYQISYCPIGSDYSRYLPENASKFKVWLATYLGVMFVTIWLESLGALSALVSTNADPMSTFAQLMGVFTIPAMIVVILSLMPINIMAVYSGGLALLAMGLPMKRWTSAIITAALGALAIWWGNGVLASTYQNFLLLLSYWIAPWLAVMLTDFFYHRVYGRASAWHAWQGMTAFIGGVVISIPFMSTVLYTGPLARQLLKGTDISYFISTIVSVFIYVAIMKLNLAGVQESFYHESDQPCPDNPAADSQVI
jgi:NCS1 family nucleobase:cation symporter-1